METSAVLASVTRPTVAPLGPPTGTPPESPPEPRAADVAAVLGGGLPLEVAFQPIIDLQRGRTAGYEALARFPALAGGARPDVWFAVADRQGLGGDLEGLALSQALQARASLPADCFLSVNVSPHLISTPPVQQALAGDLRGVVVELTEHVGNGDEAVLLEALRSIRARGAVIALDDAGSGYAGLRQVAVVRPGLVKLDRSLVEGVDRDPVKHALARLLGNFAGELDAWLLAEGIETHEELHTFVAMGVALGQGFLLGRPSPTFEVLDPALGMRIAAASAGARARYDVAALVSPVASRRGPGSIGPGAGQTLLPCVVLDDSDRPIALDLEGRSSAAGGGVMTVHPGDAVADATARAMSRPRELRWDPLVMTGGRGQVLGLVFIDALVARLAELQQVSERDETPVSARVPAGPTGAPDPEETDVKRFACGDVVPGCAASFIGADDADVLGQVALHAASEHGITDLDAELIALVKSHIGNA